MLLVRVGYSICLIQLWPSEVRIAYILYIICWWFWFGEQNPKGTCSLGYIYFSAKTFIQIHWFLHSKKFRGSHNLYESSTKRFSSESMDQTYDYYYTQSPSNIQGCRYPLGNLEFSGIFSEWESVLAAILISAVLTLPAISVYFRTRAEKPMRSYFYSCLVKGIVSFLTNGVLSANCEVFKIEGGERV